MKKRMSEGISDDSLLSVPLCLAVVGILSIAVSMRTRARLFGNLPKRGAVLVVSNHIHDLDGAFVPPRLFLHGNWRYPVYCVASQRMFEPGFLAIRGPRWLSPWLGSLNIGPILRKIGIRPIEEPTRTRPLYSWTAEVRHENGNLPLVEVIDSAHVDTLLPTNTQQNLRISNLFDAKWLDIANQPVSLRALRHPYRFALRTQWSARKVEQIHDIQNLLKSGRTVFVTPEGKLTRDGLIGPFYSIIDALEKVTDKIYLSSISYDPLRPNRLGAYCHIAAYSGTLGMPQAIAASRIMTASHILAKALSSLERAVTAQEVVEFGIHSLKSLPAETCLAPDLQRRPKRTLLRAFNHMVSTHYLKPVTSFGDQTERTRYQIAAPWIDKRFPHVPDLFVFLNNQLTETTASLKTLRAGPLL